MVPYSFGVAVRMDAVEIGAAGNGDTAGRSERWRWRGRRVRNGGDNAWSRGYRRRRRRGGRDCRRSGLLGTHSGGVNRTVFGDGDGGNLALAHLVEHEAFTRGGDAQH